MEERPPRTAALFITILLALLLVAYAMAIEPYSINKTRNSFSIFPTGSGSGPVRIVFISDIHAAYDMPGYFSKVVEAVNAEHPDIILIGGDMVEGSQQDLAGLGALSRLESRYGVFAVQGNHDYSTWGCGNWSYAGIEKADLERINITILSNENRVLSIKGHTFALVGIDDGWACRSDYGKSVAGIPEGLPRVILVHQQTSLDGKKLQSGDLVLAGHTHCGQVRIPLLTDYLIRLFGSGDYPGGLYHMPDGSSLYVTCGITPGGIRLNAPPEVSVIELN